MELKTTSVYERNIRAYREGFRHIVNQGGARSSKTFSVLELLYLIAKGSTSPLLISVVSESLPHLKRGAIRDFKEFLQASGEWQEESWRKVELTYSVNKSTIEFFSCDIPGKVHGPSRDILFINECNRIDFETAQQLIIRTKRVCLYDFNPVCEFWVHTEIVPRDDCKYIKSTFLDNPYLDETIKAELLHAGKRNENFHKVYVLGEIGQVEGTVFNDWDIGEFDDSLQAVYGQDYGFSIDPTTLIRISVDEKKKTVYADECFYKPGLSTDQISELNRHHAGASLIVGDSAEPRLIDELRKKGNNITAAVKGQGSVSAGITALQGYTIMVTERSVNLQKELRNYVWLDKGGKLVIDDYNHCIDALRYGFEKLTMYKRGNIW